MPRDTLQCKELVELITDYFEQALPPADRRRFEDHLAACPPCQEYLRQMSTTIGAVGQISEDDMDPEMRASLLDTFRTWKNR